MNRILRAPWHDYHSRCIYMVTINKNPLIRDFGILEGDYRLPINQPGSSFVSTTAIGSAIKAVLRRFYTIEPAVRILQYALMPDHIHILLFVEYPTEATLGQIIARFKIAVNSEAGGIQVFSKGFNDQILKPSRSLQTLFNYLRDNPRRLAVRRAHPEFFKRMNALKIGGKTYQAYGNFQLLECPFKEQVVVHRADTPETRRRNRDLWLYTAANGGILVSPFISPAEKAIRREAEASGGRIIIITYSPMDERYKPAATDFDLCQAGRLLIVSSHLPDSFSPSTLSRPVCLAMNALALTIAKENF